MFLHEAVSTPCSVSGTTIYIGCRYEFEATNPGTHWWHSHTGFQTGDGLYGALIVREPPTADSRYHMYDHDMSEHVLMVADFPDRPQIYRYMEEMQDRWVHPYVGINGKMARVMCAMNF